MSENTLAAATLTPEILEEAREAFNAKFPIEFAGSRARAMAFSLWLDAWSAALASAQREERAELDWNYDLSEAPFGTTRRFYIAFRNPISGGDPDVLSGRRSTTQEFVTGDDNPVPNVYAWAEIDHPGLPDAPPLPVPTLQEEC